MTYAVHPTRSSDPDRTWTRHACLGDLSLRLDTIVAAPAGDPTAPDAAEQLRAWAAADGAPDPGAVLHEKVFGALAVGAAVRRSRGGLPWSAVPLTYVGARPCAGGPLAGLQRWSVAAEGGAALRVSPVTLDGRVVGRLAETPGLRLALLSDLTGVDGGGRLLPGTGAQCAAMFERARRALAGVGLSFRDVARTWIYVPRLLDWYGELNRVRDDFFSAVGVRRPDAPYEPPASTGIQGGHPDGAECFLDVLAVAPGPAVGAAAPRPFERLRTRRQNEPHEYGSSFSRGMRVAPPAAAQHLLLVSGTASIDPAGRSVHDGDHDAQLVETWLAAAAVLGAGGGGAADVATGVLFCKDEAAWRRHLALVEGGRLPALPAIPVYADVCRPELLVELEVTGVVPAA